MRDERSGRNGPPGSVRRWLARVVLGFEPVSRDELTRLSEEWRESRTAFQQHFETVDRRLDIVEEAIRGVQARIESLFGALGRVTTAESRLDTAEDALRGLQVELERIREGTLPGVETRLHELAAAAEEMTSGLEEIRDRRLPAAVGRADVLVDRLASQLEEVASLVDRLMAREPLPVVPAGPDERRIAGVLGDVQPGLMDELRGPADVIAKRLRPYVELLGDHPPVLEIGSGRGELLELLRDRGVEAQGVEADRALAAGMRRRGLNVTEGDALDFLASQPDGAFGAVAAVHVFEHLATAELVRVLAQARRVLRPEGVLVVECPNVATLRVGAHEFWLDPTHSRPLPEKTLGLFLRASGLELVRTEHLRRFPENERLRPIADGLPDGGPREIQTLVEAFREFCERIDDLLNGPRDLLIVARRPSA